MDVANLFRSFTFGAVTENIALDSSDYCPADYAEHVEAGCALEAKYLKTGPWPVAELTARAAAAFQYYELFYPVGIKGRAPAVIFANGTGVKVSRYAAVLRHLASWGIIAIGTEEEFSFSGFSAEMCFRYLERLDGEKTLQNGEANPLFEKIDVRRVGISGHSQGGVAVINAVTETPHADRYCCAFALSPTNPGSAHELLWDYDAKKIHIPIALLAGTGFFEDKVIISAAQLAELFASLSKAPYKLMARRYGVDHGAMLYSADGVMTAFFRWQLAGDREAECLFSGKEPELIHNPLYRDCVIEERETP